VLNGLLYGAIMRYADNMLRLFVIGGAALLSTALAAAWLGVRPTVSFAAAVGLVLLALALYYPPGRLARAALALPMVHKASS
jgi:hypothetical protein